MECHDSRARNESSVRAAGNLHKQLAYRLTRKYVSDALFEIGENSDDSRSIEDESSVNGQANAVALSPGRVTSSVNTSTDTKDHHVMMGHLNSRLLRNSAGKCGINLTGR